MEPVGLGRRYCAPVLSQDSLEALFGESLAGEDLSEITEMDGWTSFRASWLRYALPGHEDTLAVKLGSNWQPGDAEAVYDETRRLGDLLARAPGPVSAVNLIGWSSEPEAIAMTFVPGSTMVEAVGLDGSGEESARVARAFGMALGSYHSAGEARVDVDEVRSELEASARRVLIDRTKAWELAEGLAAASCYELSTNDLWVGSRGELLLLDPPVEPAPRLVHRDLSAVVVGLKSARQRLTGEAAVRASLALQQFLEGYGETGPTDLALPSDRWALRLYEASRVAGVAYGHFRRRRLRKGVRATWRGLALRTSMGISGQSAR